VLPGRSKRGNLDNFAKLLTDFDLVGLQEADAVRYVRAFSTRPSTLLKLQALFALLEAIQPNRKIAQSRRQATVC